MEERVRERAGPLPFESAARFLPEGLREKALALPDVIKERAEEIRLRAGGIPEVVTDDGEVYLSDEAISPLHIARLVENATGASEHSFGEGFKRGFITLSGGHRLGLCGTGVVKNGEVFSQRDFSSANLRIAREKHGVSDGLAGRVVQQGRVWNTLILSPPGFGKTTLLRDLIRNLSSGDGQTGGFRVSVVDERGEIAGTHRGQPQFDLGRRTDVMEGVPKAQSMEMLIRAMSPQVLAVDEITSAEDVRAVEQAAYCGVSLIATTHAENEADFKNRPVYRLLRSSGVFAFRITIAKQGGRRMYQLTGMEEWSE